LLRAACSYSVALFGDHIAASSPNRDNISTDTGAVYIFTKNAAGYYEAHHLVVDSTGYATYDRIGYTSSAVSMVDNMVAVGAQ
jgi:hypothetical protein